MHPYYSWLLSLCCKAKIYSGLFNKDDRNKCSDCGNEIVDMDKGSYDTRTECYVFLHTSQETNKHYVIADTYEEAEHKFHNGEAESTKYVNYSTDTVDWEFLEKELIEL